MRAPYLPGLAADLFHRIYHHTYSFGPGGTAPLGAVLQIDRDDPAFRIARQLSGLLRSNVHPRQEVIAPDVLCLIWIS